MSNTTYIEEVLKESSVTLNVIYIVLKYKIGPRGADEIVNILRSLFKSKLTQAIRDTEVKTAGKFLALGRVHPDHVLSVSEPAEDVNYVVEHEKLEKLANSIINTNQED